MLSELYQTVIETARSLRVFGFTLVTPRDVNNVYDAPDLEEHLLFSVFQAL